MKVLLAGILALLLTGCAALQTSQTEARWQISENQYVDYESNKDQQGLEARIEEIDPETGKVTKTIYVKADKSGTPEQLFALMAQQNAAVAEFLKELAPLLRAASGAMVP